MSQSFPAQDIPESQKTVDWAKGHFLYAEDLLNSNLARSAKFSRLYDTYNGIVKPKSVEYLTQTYGKRNRTKYISYRLSKTKIDLINNDWLVRPLNSTVTTVNMLAKTAKLEQYETVLGAINAKKEIEGLRKVGVDPLDGMNIPDKGDETIWQTMSAKDKNESVMQVLINSGIADMDLKEKFNKNFQDVLITGMCFGQNTVTIDGDDNYITIAPQDAIFVEVDRDTFMEKSPIMGHRERMTLHDVLRKFNWTDTEREKLKNTAKTVSANASDSSYRNRYTFIGGELTIDVIHIEWKSLRPTYYKISPLTKSQELVNPPDTKYRIELDTEYYEQNIEMFKKDVAKGKYDIETKWQEELWEGWQVGHDMYKDVRRKPFTMRREDAPGDVYAYSYTGMLANTVNGYRISLQELMTSLSDAFDIVMYQIMREIGKVKGKAIVYDSAALPRNTTIKDVLYQLMNDNFININTAAAGNMSMKDVASSLGIKEVDLGLSQSFGSLVETARELRIILDGISGINNDRVGGTPASSTATNAQSNIQNSRIITEGWFFLTGMFCEKVLTKVAQQRKLIWGLYKPNKAQIVLGDEKFGFMRATMNLAYSDYVVKLVDGGKELDIRRKIFGLAEASLNTKELRYQDLMEMEMTETLADAKAVLKKAWKEIQAVASERQSQAEQAQMAMNQESLQTQIEIADADREDRQAAKLEEISFQGDTDIRVNNSKAKGTMIIDQNNLEQNSLLGNQSL